MRSNISRVLCQGGGPRMLCSMCLWTHTKATSRPSRAYFTFMGKCPIRRTPLEETHWPGKGGTAEGGPIVKSLKSHFWATFQWGLSDSKATSCAFPFCGSPLRGKWRFPDKRLPLGHSTKVKDNLEVTPEWFRDRIPFCGSPSPGQWESPSGLLSQAWGCVMPSSEAILPQLMQWWKQLSFKKLYKSMCSCLTAFPEFNVNCQDLSLILRNLKSTFASWRIGSNCWKTFEWKDSKTVTRVLEEPNERVRYV